MSTPKHSGIVVLIICGCALPLQPAEASWWDKAKAIFESKEASQVASAVTTDDIGAAFKEALQIGADAVVSQLGASGGFNEDPAVRIPLPQQLDKVKGMLEKFGMGSMVDNLELKLNEAAEAATPKAKALFSDAISEMTFDDVKQIYSGPKDSATQYFRDKMSPELIAEMQPIVEASLSEVGAVRTFDQVMQKYKTLPFVPEVDADLDSYVVGKTLDGIFLYLAQQEAAIREDPVRQTTELLKRVFGAK